MKRTQVVAAVALAVILMGGTGAPAQPQQEQQQGQKSPRPPEVEKLLKLAKDPDRLREALSDPRQVQELMDLVESDAVRDFVSDPQRVMELTAEINPRRLREVVRSIDPSIFQRAAMARWMEQLRNRLGATEEEWALLAPRVEALLRAQQEVRTGVRGTGGGRAFGNFPSAGQAETSELELAAEAVRLCVRDPSVPDRDAALALKEYRKLRDKAREELAAAERHLREIVTHRQEAILLMMGLLE